MIVGKRINTLAYFFCNGFGGIRDWEFVCPYA
jgi:hypothetical protein